MARVVTPDLGPFEVVAEDTTMRTGLSRPVLMAFGSRCPYRFRGSDDGYGQPWDAGMSSGPVAGAAKNVATNTVTPPVAFQAVWVCP